MRFSEIIRVLSRRRRNDEQFDKSQLARKLNLFDLTTIGVGATLGLGVYVLAGSVAYEQAGPAVTISFLIAAIASGFAGLCYAEFASRVPSAGSAYIYSYVSVGEFIAFTTGWNLILELLIGGSAGARGMSAYIDSLIDNQMGDFLIKHFPMNVDFLADYPDIFSFIVVIFFSILIAIGVKESSIINSVFAIVNVITILIILVAGSLKADPDNWKIEKDKIPEGVNGGNGGFMPFGFDGVMSGAATCFYGFVGFDIIATTGEEALNPQRNIPLSIILTLVISFFAYFGISTVLTMSLPYYLQDPVSPFPHLFQELGWIEIKWIVTIGAIFALCSSLFAAVFGLPRILYAMGNDGLIFKFLSIVHPKTKTPIISIMLSGFLAGIMVMLFNLQQLVEMMSIGTLMAYTLVAICVLILRYQNSQNTIESEKSRNLLSRILNLQKSQKNPNEFSTMISKFAIFGFTILSIILCALLKFASIFCVWSIVGVSVVIILMILTVFVIARQPSDSIQLQFKVPFVPILPCVSIFFNLYLMFQLDINTWIRLVVWLVVGYIIYFSYGIRNSEEGKRSKNLEK